MKKIFKGLTQSLSDSVQDYRALMFSDKSSSAQSYFDLMFSDPVTTSLPVRNATETWLYDSKAENYERVLKKILSSASYEGKFNVPQYEVQSYFHQYLMDELIGKNKLAPEIEKGKKINPNVIVVWFQQYLVREKFKEGKDPILRCQGARTQSEVMKAKAHSEGKGEAYAPSHHLKNLESEGWKVAQVAYKVDSETGHQLGEPDYYVSDYACDDLEEESENEYMKELLLQRFGEDKVNMYYSLWLELRYEAYESKKSWAEARKTTTTILTQQIERVRDVFIENRDDFGY